MSSEKRSRKESSATNIPHECPLTVKLCHVESVILMLKSDEDEARSNACEALYEFLTKSDQSTVEQISRELCELLFPMLCGENKLLKRNAMLVFEALSRCAKARYFIRKIPDCLYVFEKLLRHDEFDSTKELVLAVLSQLCFDVHYLNEIIQSNILNIVVDFLEHKDPDVQKNAIEVLFKTVKDFEARNVLRKPALLQALMRNFNSEYPAIQKLSLQTLTRAAQDAHIRSLLRETNVFPSIIHILGQNELADLHKYALDLFANLLEDESCVKYLLDTKCLQLLLHFVSDQTMYKEEESLEVPRDHGKPSGRKSTTKRSKKEEPKKKAEESKPPVRLSPECKIHACMALTRASRKDTIRRMLHEIDVEQLLASLLTNDEDDVRTAATLAIATLGENPASQKRLLELNVLENFTRMVRCDQSEMRAAVTKAIAVFTTENPIVCQDLSTRVAGIESVLMCLTPTYPNDETTVNNALTIVQNLNADEMARPKLRKLLNIADLIPLLNHSSPQTQSRTASLVASLVSDLKSVKRFCRNEGLKILVTLLESHVTQVHRNACWAIHSLAVHPELNETLIQDGVLVRLQQLNQSEKRRSPFSEMAFERILNANLNAKFALTNYLDYTDRLSDRFYDTGPITDAADFHLLNSHLQKPLSDERVVLLVNIKPNHDENLEEDYMELIEENEEFETPESTLPPLEADSTLTQWLHSCVERFSLLTSQRHQTEELGRFVANCYGGPIEENEYPKFRPELEMAKVRCAIHSNVVPIGSVKIGGQLIRALLFKFLADHIGLPTNLVRGEYGRSFNEIQLPAEVQDASKRTESYVVDLMFKPGGLMEKNGAEARKYISFV